MTSIRKPTILVTNDDGISSAGIRVLWQALKRFADVVVIAPDHNWSAAGHAKTIHKPLRAEQITLDPDIEMWVSTGAPSDCVALALNGLIERPIDLVVSGVNQGPNLGQDITYSGTLAAAFEALISGVPAVAVSSMNFKDDEDLMRPAAEFAARLVEYVWTNQLLNGVVLNVNYPNNGGPRGVHVTRLGRRSYRDKMVKRIDPRGRPYYWLGGDLLSGDNAEPGTDIRAIRDGYVSITPIHLDMTNYTFLEKMQSWPLETLLA